MSKMIDLTGQRFGYLTVIRRAEENTKAGKAKWVCKCDCGNESIATGRNLVSGNSTSCGCMKNQLIDLTGRRFNHLTVIGRADNDKWGKAQWKCVCDCGNECVVMRSNLKHQKSCGCDLCRPEVEKVDKRIIRIWAGMYSRCYNDNEYNIGYKNYGGRGIKICDEWLGKGGCRRFYEWAMKNGYRKDLTIDRIDVNGNYEPSNCRWADLETQSNNKRNSIRVLYEGRKVSPHELSKITGINVGTIYTKYYKERSMNENGSLIDFTGWKPREW